MRDTKLAAGCLFPEPPAAVNPEAVMEESKKIGLLQKARHEFGEYLWSLTYMALFFCVFATYRMLVTRDFHAASYEYATALLQALVLSKVVLIGQHAHVGERHEHRSLILSAIYKSLLFAVLVALFHVAEDFVKDLFHGSGLSAALHDVADLNFPRLIALTVVVFCVFIPFFALWETRRVIGPPEFDRLFFRRGQPGRIATAAQTEIHS
jgi:hypothetical protein